MASLIFEKAIQRLSHEKLSEIRLSVEIVERIDILMQKHNINQKQLAQKMGKNPSEINKWLSGTHNFTLKTIIRLETLFGESILSVVQMPSLELVTA
jgi:transcriptional regulator with XRE-family HTH domain